MKSKIKQQTNLIPMQENLGLGHKGNILITTQERIDKNLPPIANNILDEDFSHLICRNVNNFDGLIEILELFIDDEECRFDHHGYCQEHGVTEPCRNQAAKDLIAKIKTKQ